MEKKCPRCQSRQIYSFGDSVPTKKGQVTHYKCLQCKYFFTDKEMFEIKK